MIGRWSDAKWLLTDCCLSGQAVAVVAAAADRPPIRTTGRASRAKTSTMQDVANATGASCRDRRTWAAAGRARAASAAPSPSSRRACFPRRPSRRVPDCTRREIGAAANAGPCASRATSICNSLASLAQRRSLPAAASSAPHVLAWPHATSAFRSAGRCQRTQLFGELGSQMNLQTLPVSDTVLPLRLLAPTPRCWLY